MMTDHTIILKVLFCCCYLANNVSTPYKTQQFQIFQQEKFQQFVVGVRNFDEEIDGIGVDKIFDLEVQNHSVANACLLSSSSSSYTPSLLPLVLLLQVVVFFYNVMIV
jgi:hypothetical protein